VVDGAISQGKGAETRSLIAEAPRTATVTAETDIVALGLTSWEFQPIVETNASIAWKLLETLARRTAEQQ
jgi:CRP/FNR family cyclic AMP-dependent transcriptional regulator